MLHVHTIDLKTPGDRPEIVRTKYFSTLFKIIDTVQKKELIINETVQQYSLTHQMSIMLFVVKILSTIILFYCGKKRFYRKNCFGYICISQKRKHQSFIYSYTLAFSCLVIWFIMKHENKKKTRQFIYLASKSVDEAVVACSWLVLFMFMFIGHL
jgi:hypothetical protein